MREPGHIGQGLVRALPGSLALAPRPEPLLLIVTPPDARIMCNLGGLAIREDRVQMQFV